MFLYHIKNDNLTKTGIGKDIILMWKERVGLKSPRKSKKTKRRARARVSGRVWAQADAGLNRKRERRKPPPREGQLACLHLHPRRRLQSQRMLMSEAKFRKYKPKNLSLYAE